jgi:hypothetical protein
MIHQKAHAEKLLGQLKASAAIGTDSGKQLQAAYERLWDRNRISGLEKERENLFRLVLCSFRPLTFSALAEALCFSFEEKDQYDSSLTDEDVQNLGADFLVENTDSSVGFAHDSGKAFVSRLDPKTGREHTDGEPCTFEQARNHRYVAQMYVQIMERPKHPIWEDSDIHDQVTQWLEAPTKRVRRHRPV